MKTRKGAQEAINVVTLGCSKNLVDSERLLSQLVSNGIQVMHNDETFKAKTVIINTCGFILDAKKESVETILRFISAKEEGKIRQVFVTGCLSQRYLEDLRSSIPDVDIYFGTNDLESIINNLGLSYKQALLGKRYLTTPKHYAYLKVSEGCNRKCSFCAIPLIRGRHSSTPISGVYQEAEFLASQGVKEVMLIAQDLTSYGIDIYGKKALSELLTELSKIKDIEWIRLHYAYPRGFPLSVLKIMKEQQNICKYLDIPFQHNSDQVLLKMRRNHTKSQNQKLIEAIRKDIPDLALRTTLITGHPGETDRAFKELVEFVKNSEFERLGVFTYSEEEGTWAARNYKDRIPEEVKKERADELMSIQQNISMRKNISKIGDIVKVIIDGREGDYYQGRTEWDSPEIDNEVLIKRGTANLTIGKFYQAKITAAEEFDLYGIIA
jgi:ribosomal protein S12 methylthiotransferase